jgi:hypothetical protein
MSGILFNSHTLNLDHREFDPDVIILANKISGIVDQKLDVVTSYLTETPEYQLYQQSLKSVTSMDLTKGVKQYSAIAMGLLWKRRVVFSLGSTYSFAMQLYKNELEQLLYGEEMTAIEALLGVYGTFGYHSSVGYIDKVFYDAWVFFISENLELYIDYISMLNWPAQPVDIRDYAISTLETFLARDHLLYSLDVEVLGAIEFSLEQKLIEHIDVLRKEALPEDLRLLV